MRKGGKGTVRLPKMLVLIDCCPTCPKAHMCDKTCGFCGEPHKKRYNYPATPWVPGGCHTGPSALSRLGLCAVHS